ncbi:MAG: ZmpA/ZmpB/ZmpC family metallo-endopeptidase-related protein, partial [Christensenellales bacterium]
WIDYRYSLESGNHTILLKFVKDDLEAGNDDCVYLRNIAFNTNFLTLPTGITLNYGDVSADLTEGLEISHDFVNDSGRNYILTLPTLEDGVSAILEYNDNQYNLVSGENVLPDLSVVNNVYKVSFIRSGFASVSVSFNINVGNLVITDSTFGDGMTFANDSTNAWAMSLYNGKVAFTSTIQGMSSTSTAITLTTSKQGELSFAYKVSSETNYDKFTINIDGTDVVTDSGDGDWVDYVYTLDNSTHTIILKYAKDSSADRNDDCVYLRELSFSTNFLSVPADIVLNYEGATSNITEGIEIAHDYINNSGRVYTLNIPTLDEGVSAKLEYNGNSYALTSGDNTLPVFEGLNNTYSIVFTKTGYASASVSFIINVSNVISGNNFGGLTFVNDSTNAWEIIFHNGKPAFKSTIEGMSSTLTTMTFSVVGPCIISMPYVVSSEPTWDKLIISIDDEEFLTDSGDNNWANLMIPISSGAHTLTVTYSKDSSANSHLDCVMIGEPVVYEGNATVSVVSSNESLGAVTGGATVEIGNSVTLVASVVEGNKFMYYKDAFDNILSTDATYTFYPTNDMNITAIFYPYVTLDEIIVSDGETSETITADKSYSYDFFTQSEKEYTISIPNISDGKTYKITFNDVVKPLVDNAVTFKAGNYQYNKVQIVVSQENFADIIIVLNFIADYSSAITPNYTPAYQGILDFDGNASSYGSFSGATKDGYKVIVNDSNQTYSYYYIMTNDEEGLLSFDYRIEKGDTSSAFRVYAEYQGFSESSITGDLDKACDWTTFIYQLPAGTTKIKIVFYCRDSADYAWVKDFKIVKGLRNVVVTNGNSSAGDVTEINSTYDVGKTINLSATVNAGYVFVGWVDETKGLLSSSYEYSLVINDNFSITATYIAVGGDNTSSNPLDFNALTNYAVDNVNLYYYLTSNVSKIYVKNIENYTLFVDGASQTSADYYEIALNQNVALKFVSNNNDAEYFNVAVYNWGNSIYKNGNGTEYSPYQITNEKELKAISQNLGGFYKLVNNITLASAWTPIGTSSAQFTGYFDGGNYTIDNLVISSGDYLGLFGVVSGATIKNLNLTNVNITGSTFIGGLAGKVESGVISNITLNVNITTIVENNLNKGVGGVVGYADDDNAIFNNITVRGNVITKASVIGTNNCIGGFAGNGGVWNDSITYAYVLGGRMVGGFVGGYQCNATFNNCLMAGKVEYGVGQEQNYPYFGIANGYGAWSSYFLTNSGQRISVDYTSTMGVSAIDVFNASETPDGKSVAVPSLIDGKYSFTVDALFKDTYASMGLLSETKPNGVTSNYGGITIRFTMANGTYKYICTLDKNIATFVSSFNLNLDDMTSYVDNFASMVIEDNGGTKTRTTDTSTGVSISVWGVVNVGNANDFEHLSWIINGGIPTTIGGYYYNNRSVATLSIKMTSDIDLTSERTAVINDTTYYLNRKMQASNGDLIYNFYGFGSSDMMPFRGSFDGGNHSLTVNMVTEKAFELGIISFSSEQNTAIYVKNLSVYGNISGCDRIGIVGSFDSYSRTTSITFDNVKNYANIRGYKQVGGLLGYVQGDNSSSTTYVTVKNCANYGAITGTTYNGKASNKIGGLVGCVTNSGGISASFQF